MAKIKVGIIEASFGFTNQVLKNTTNMEDKPDKRHGDFVTQVMLPTLPFIDEFYPYIEVEFYALPANPLAISEAVKLDLDIINLSRTDSTMIAGQQSVENAWKSFSEEHDIFLVAAAGNDGDDKEEFAASQDHWLAVGALGLDGKRTSYSSYGLGAVFCMMQGDWDFNGDGTPSIRGTSFAAPHLVINVVPYLGWFKETHGRKSTKAETKQYIKDNCRDIELEGKDQFTGYGVFVPEILKLDDSDYFTDDDGKWFEDTVNYLAENDLISGYPDGTIRGDKIPTRAEVFSIIEKLHKALK